MYEVAVLEHFDAAHFLKDYDGKCENIHGHRFEVEVGLEMARLDPVGLGYDYALLRAALKEIVDRLDHVLLNDLDVFAEMNPSSENLARLIYEQTKDRIKADGVRVKYVKVWESPEAWSTYTPDGAAG
ncbi:MAG: 6-carboxytetrahydropterin synthase QueD [Chloroflexi bacterium]|nr:6-carboxytetrahydropterin synthase QueD [Chloroflexota bacterium]